MSMQSGSTGPFDIGEVLGDTFAVIGRSFVKLANIAVMLVGIPAAVRIAGVALIPVSPIFGLLAGIGWFLTLAGMIVAQAAITQLAMNDLHGQAVADDVMFKTALRRFWPMLGFIVLIVLGVCAGTLLLIVPVFLLGLAGSAATPVVVLLLSLLLVVPGIILGLAWSVVFPALVLEGRGVFDSIKRSAALTRGKRWSIFLLFFIVGLVWFIVELVLFAVFGGFRGLLSPQASVTTTVLTSLLGVVSIPFGAVIATALFNTLRGKAGYGAEAVAEVFA